MVLYLIFHVILLIIGAIFAFFPTITELPWGVDANLQAGVAGYKLFAEYFPPLTLFLTLTTIYISFKLLMIIMRFFLGHRTPHLG